MLWQNKNNNLFKKWGAFMTELLFILTIIYVAYVIYKVADESKTETPATKSGSVATILTPSGPTPVVETVVDSVAEPVPVVENKPEEKVEVKPAPVVSSSNLRDPDTGEAAKVTNNYRGLKRWLKEALVKEGLLEKVYPTTELNDETNAKIREALEKIKTMPKYHA
jgi:hypothetical protein